MWSAAATKNVFLDRARVQHRLPVVFFQRTAHPFGRHQGDVDARVGEQARHLRKTQVVTGHQPEPQAVDDERLRRREFAGLDPVGLALTEGVVQVELSINGPDAVAPDRHDRVAHTAAVVGLLEQPRHDDDVEVGSEGGQGLDERTVEVLGVPASEASNGLTK